MEGATTTKRGGKKRLPPQDFFELLKSLKNEVNWVQAPGGHALIKFLAEKAGVSTAVISNKLDLFEKLGLIERGLRGNEKEILWRVRLVVPERDESRLTQHYQKQEEEISQRKMADGLNSGARRFLVLIDYRNLEQNVQNPVERLKDFSWLLNPILEKGRILLVFVFIPDHYTTRAGIMQLTQKHRFNVVICPRQIEGVKTKDADTVDTKIYELAYPLIDHSDVTDIVVVAGDRDFVPLAVFARNQQKKVHIVSAAQALSGHWRELEKSGAVEIETVQ